jgi:L-iditol 2-dehydrogenase
MKALVVERMGRLSLKEIETPSPGQGEVLVKVGYCGICGTDVEGYKSGLYGRGTIMGHEFSGKIAELGSGVEGWNIGDDVTVNPVLSCGKCIHCRQNRPNLCEKMGLIGMTSPGGLAEYVKVPSRLLVKIPDGVFQEHAALTEPLSVVLHGIGRSSLKLGDTALVIGAGTIGLLVIQCAFLHGAKAVYVSEINEKRLSLSKKLATNCINSRKENLQKWIKERTGGKGVEEVFECTGKTSAIYDAFSSVSRGGEIYIFGVFNQSVKIDLLQLMYRSLRLSSSYTNSGEFYWALDYIKNGLVDVGSIITSRIPLEEAIEGFKRLETPETSEVKILVRP